MATLVSICSRQAFCFWQVTFRRLLSHNVFRRICKLVMDFDFLLLDRSWPVSSKCDLTSGMFVLPMRSSINWKKIGQRSPSAPCSNLLLCVPPFVTYIASIGSWIVSLFIETAEDLNCSLELSSWNRLFLGNLPSQESNLLQLERRIVERTQRESGRSKSDLSQPFGVSWVSSELSEATDRFLSNDRRTPGFPTSWPPCSLCVHLHPTNRAVE